MLERDRLIAALNAKCERLEQQLLEAQIALTRNTGSASRDLVTTHGGNALTAR